jgi:hypothetical protein
VTVTYWVTGSLVTVTNFVIGTQPLEVEACSKDLTFASLLFESSSLTLAAVDDGDKVVES